MNKLNRVFLSHSSEDQEYAVGVAARLNKCVPGGAFCYQRTKKTSWPQELSKELARCSHMVVFIGDTESDHQDAEVSSFYARVKKRLSYIYVVDCRSKIFSTLPDRFALFESVTRYPPPKKGDKEGDDKIISPSFAEEAAREIVETFGFNWMSGGLPGLPENPYLFDYEKDIIDFYVQTQHNKGSGNKDVQEKLCHGVPPKWPTVHKIDNCTGKTKTINPERRLNSDSLQAHVGDWRDPSENVLVAALSKYHRSIGKRCDSSVCLLDDGFFFPEAGPRKEHVFPHKGNKLKVGILVSGGIAPGINAVIDGITSRHYLYARSKEDGQKEYTIQVLGLHNGYLALDGNGDLQNRVNLLPSTQKRDQNSIVTSDFANTGGSILSASRTDLLLDPQKKHSTLESFAREAAKFDILYVIGGDGSMKAAHAIWSYAHSRAQSATKRPVSVVCIPKTMDNDILWVWRSFGFLSAVERAREIISDLYTEIKANPRICIVQLFGSDSGFVVSHAVLASQAGTCDVALIPEVPFTMQTLAEHIMTKITERLGKQSPNRITQVPGALIVMAETAIPEDALDFLDDRDVGLTPGEKKALKAFHKNNRRIEGKTDECLRSAGLKVISRGLEKIIKSGTIEIDSRYEEPDWGLLETITNEPRHQLRAVPPSTMDIISGQRLGTLAVDNALAGYTDFMISQWLTEFVLVPLDLVVLGRKRIHPNGVFWRSVKSKTGQSF